MDQKVGFLGPEGSFSSQVARKHFPGWTLVPMPGFEEIIEAVIHRDCEAGITPFENSNSKSIVELQIAVAERRGQVFVTDLLPHQIDHYLFSKGQLAEIKEVRSKDVVFAQTDHWLRQNLPDANRKDCPSTSAAVKSLVGDDSPFLSAIASKDALLYGIPIIAEKIQTEPNITIFCRLERGLKPIDELTSVLVGIQDFAEEDFLRCNELVVSYGCAVTSNWVLFQYPHRFGVFEVTKVASNSNLLTATAQIERRLQKAFLVGGYAGKSITEIISGKHLIKPNETSN